MHPQTKRLKFNILLTTYEILLKDKVIALLWGDKNNFPSIEFSLDLHVFGLWPIKFMASLIVFAFESTTVYSLAFWFLFLVGAFLILSTSGFCLCVVRLSAFSRFVRWVTLNFLQFAWDSHYCNDLLPSSCSISLQTAITELKQNPILSPKYDTELGNPL